MSNIKKNLNNECAPFCIVCNFWIYDYLILFANHNIGLLYLILSLVSNNTILISSAFQCDCKYETDSHYVQCKAFAFRELPSYLVRRYSALDDPLITEIGHVDN